MISHSQRDHLKKELENRQNMLINNVQDHYGQAFEHAKESVGELSNYDNHPGDLGTELFERQKDIALNAHAEKELEDINCALHAMAEGTYGICSACGRDIPYERLEAVPTADKCFEHANHQPVYLEKRPPEEEIYSPNINPDEMTEETQVGYDAEDTWQDVARYGTSDSPSDFYEDKADYDEMYENSDEYVGETEAIEGIAAADINGNFEGIANNYNEFDEVEIEQEME